MLRFTFLAILLLQSIILHSEAAVKFMSRKTFATSVNQFSNDLMKQLEKENENVVYSPLSISLGLGMLLDGAKTETAEEIYSVLKMSNFTNRNTVQLYLHNLIEEYKSMHERNSNFRNVTLELANMAVFSKSYTIREEYKQDLMEMYFAAVQEEDIANNAPKVTEMINNFVKNRTHDLIPKLLNSQLPADTVFFLLNTLYFKGFWENMFMKQFTSKRTFYNSDKTESEVDMMSNQFDSFPHFICDVHNVTLLELKYKGSISMIIILPHEKNGIHRIVHEMSFDVIEHLIGEMKMGRIPVVIPKFNVQFEANLENVLPKMGMNLAFSNTADLSGITTGIKVSKAIHKSIVKVDEAGTVAAAATGLIAIPLSAFIGPRFTCDHPFAFIIRDMQSNVNLFHGVVNKL